MGVEVVRWCPSDLALAAERHTSRQSTSCHDVWNDWSLASVLIQQDLTFCESTSLKEEKLP